MLGVAAIWIFDSSTVSENGLFQGYNIITVIIILQQVLNDFKKLIDIKIPLSVNVHILYHSH